MAVLPSFIPARTTTALAAALHTIGVVLGPLKAGTRLTHAFTCEGIAWELTYLGPMGDEPVWSLTGPGVEHGIAVTAEEAIEHITGAASVTPEPEPEPDPYPRAPRTHAGVPVPDLVRSQWGSPLSDGWCLGVWSTKAAVAGA